MVDVLFIQDVPPDLSVSVFVLEQALSVRALQEMVGASNQQSTVTITFQTFLFSYGKQYLI